MAFEGPSYLIFQDFVVRGGIWVGSTLTDGSNAGHHIRFINLDISAPTNSNNVLINSWGHHVEFIGGSSHDAPGTGPTCNVPGYFSQFCYAFYIEGNDNLFDHVKVYNNPAYAYHVYSGSPG